MHQLVNGTRRTNQEWAWILAVSTASFGRIKKVLVRWLNDDYQLTIVWHDNHLQGNDAVIRQFMYAFYFELPLLSKKLARNVAHRQ